jgi:hypothetical protein
VSSKRDQIFAAVKARFATITVAAGYQTDIGANVLEWQLTALDNGQLPASLLSDPVEETSTEGSKNSATYTRLLTIVAQLVLAETDATATMARKALADVIKAIGTDDKWGGLARRTLPKKDELVVDSESARIGGARIEFIVEYSRAPWEA